MKIFQKLFSKHKQNVEQPVSVVFKDIPDNYTCKYLTIGYEYQGFFKEDKKFIDVIDNRGVMSNYSIARFDIKN